MHTHILPAVDDGAENLSEALEMLDIAAQNGTTHIVLTPHHMSDDLRTEGFSKQELIERFNRFKQEAAVRFPKLKLFMGAENFAADRFEDMVADEMLIPINNTKYVLIEFDFDDYLPRVLNIIDMLQEAGYIPLIAHPERYEFIKRNPRNIVRLLEKRALLQVNAGSVLGYNGALVQDVALSFLENDFVTVLASDAHSTYQRVPNLAEVHSFVSTNFSSAYADTILYNNPLAIIKGENII